MHRGVAIDYFGGQNLGTPLSHHVMNSVFGDCVGVYCVPYILHSSTEFSVIKWARILEREIPKLGSAEMVVGGLLF